LADNARYHRSSVVTERIKEFELLFLFSGPYSFDTAAVERVFSVIKKGTLNQAGKTFESRTKKDVYLKWIA
jgi:transposase